MLVANLAATHLGDPTVPCHLCTASQRACQREVSAEEQASEGPSSPTLHSPGLFYVKKNRYFQYLVYFSASIHGSAEAPPLEQSDISLHGKGQATSLCARAAGQAIPNELQDAYITLVPASEVPCSATLKNGS